MENPDGLTVPKEAWRPCIVRLREHQFKYIGSVYTQIWNELCLVPVRFSPGLHGHDPKWFIAAKY